MKVSKLATLTALLGTAYSAKIKNRAQLGQSTDPYGNVYGTND